MVMNKEENVKPHDVFEKKWTETTKTLVLFGSFFIQDHQIYD